jgi:hypothetical protein
MQSSAARRRVNRSGKLKSGMAERMCAVVVGVERGPGLARGCELSLFWTARQYYNQHDRHNHRRRIARARRAAPRETVARKPQRRAATPDTPYSETEAASR